jgi:hypothetical protein
MGASSLVILSLGALLVGCATTLQPGLANATALGGNGPETRVHDVIANGEDACERSSFPEGSALRGKFPGCDSNEALSRSAAFTPAPRPRSRWLPPLYEFRPTPYCTQLSLLHAATELGTLWSPPAESLPPC